MSIQNDIDPRVQRLGLLAYYRRRSLPASEIARELGFYGSPRAMYGKMADEGNPICSWCGELYPGDDHDCKEQPKPREKQQRKARAGKGEWTELPPAEDAAELFKGVRSGRSSRPTSTPSRMTRSARARCKPPGRTSSARCKGSDDEPGNGGVRPNDQRPRERP